MLSLCWGFLVTAETVQLLSPSWPRGSIHSHQTKKKENTQNRQDPDTWRWFIFKEESTLAMSLHNRGEVCVCVCVCVCWYSHPSKWLIPWLSHSFCISVLEGGNLIIPRRLNDFSSHPTFLCSLFVEVIFKVLHLQGYFEQNMHRAVALHTRSAASASLGNLEMQILWPHSSLMSLFLNPLFIYFDARSPLLHTGSL